MDDCIDKETGQSLNSRVPTSLNESKFSKIDQSLGPSEQSGNPESSNKFEEALTKPIKLGNFLRIECFHGQLLLKLAQRCTEFEQDLRPNTVVLWKYIEKFERALGAFNEGSAHSGAFSDTGSKQTKQSFHLKQKIKP